jgi:hypothetical protein
VQRRFVLRHHPLMAALAGATVIALAGCSTDVSGSPQPAQQDSVSGQGGTSEPGGEDSGGTSQGQAPADEVDLGALLVDPSVFPPPYDAIVLPPQAITQASPDLTGIPAGAEVSPAGCKPVDVQPERAAMIVGTDNTDRATISVELIAVDEPLSVREEQLDACAEVTATKSGATSTIRSTVTPAPPIDADDTLAVRQTVSSGTGSDSVTQSMLTLMAQVGDVRISATYMSFDDTAPDAATLDEIFTTAVLKVKAG